MSPLLWVIIALMILSPIVCDRCARHEYFMAAAIIEWVAAITCAVLFTIWLCLKFAGLT